MNEFEVTKEDSVEWTNSRGKLKKELTQNE